MYRDHRKGPGGPPGGATYPGGPRGLKVEGNQPLVGWGAPLGPPPMRLGLGTLGGSFPLALGGKATPSPLWLPPPLGDPISQGRRPPGGLYKGGEGGQTHLKSWRLPLPCYTSPSRRSSAKPCCDHCCIHHHIIVLLDLHQPLLPPCWIKEETSSAPYVC